MNLLTEGVRSLLMSLLLTFDTTASITDDTNGQEALGTKSTEPLCIDQYTADINLEACGIPFSFKVGPTISGYTSVVTNINEALSESKDKDDEVSRKTPDFDYEDTSVLNITSATPEQWDEFIDELCDHRELDNCFLRGKGDVMCEIESTYGISGMALISIWTWESGLGESHIAKSRNNLAGIKKNGSYRYFDSYNDCMFYHAELLKNAYVDKGLTTWDQIGSKYCPNDDEWSESISGTVQDYNEMIYNIITT